jgi:hypothetical protein
MQYGTLRNGVQVPLVGLGTYKIPNEEMHAVLEKAFECGYRKIDTASYIICYFNNRAFGFGPYFAFIEYVFNCNFTINFIYNNILVRVRIIQNGKLSVFC